MVICSYDMLSNHVGEFNHVPFLAVVFDEVHKLKNVKTKVNEARSFVIFTWISQNY